MATFSPRPRYNPNPSVQELLDLLGEKDMTPNADTPDEIQSFIRDLFQAKPSEYMRQYDVPGDVNPPSSIYK